MQSAILGTRYPLKKDIGDRIENRLTSINALTPSHVREGLWTKIPLLIVKQGMEEYCVHNVLKKMGFNTLERVTIIAMSVQSRFITP